MFYDSYTDFLFTGDLIFPGKINISNDKDYVASLTRLQRWKETHPVKWLMGGHIEMQFVPGKVYPRFATYKPYERLLQMEPNLIDDGPGVCTGGRRQGNGALSVRTSSFSIGSARIRKRRCFPRVCRTSTHRGPSSLRNDWSQYL